MIRYLFFAFSTILSRDLNTLLFTVYGVVTCMAHFFFVTIMICCTRAISQGLQEEN